MIGSTHAQALSEVPEANLVAICDGLPDRLEEVGDRFGVEARFADHKKMLAEADLDAVYVCTHNADHCQHALAALGAGKHVFCEKPMALNAGQAKRMQSAAKKARKVFQMGMVWRFQPESRVVKDYIERGDLGRIYHIRMVLRRRRGIPGLGGWFTTKAKSGGGGLIDIGVHFFDLVMWLSDYWRPARVSGRLHAEFGPRMKDYHYLGMWAGPPKLDGVFDVDDYATGLVRFANDATLSFEVSWAGDNRDESYVELLGDKGGVRAFGNEPLTIMTEQHGRIVDVQPQYDKGGGVRFADQAANFIQSALGKEKPRATADQGVIVMQLLDAIHKSSEQGREVAIGK